MVVVYRIGKFPKAYRVKMLSCGTFVAVVLYSAAIIAPYIIAGYTQNFYPRLETRTEKPYVSILPEINFCAKGTNVDINYTVGQPIEGVSIIPQIQYSRAISANFVSIDFVLPLDIASQTLTFFDISIPISVKFNESIERNLSSVIHLKENSYLPATKAEILGSFKFIQNNEIQNIDATFPVSESYLEYAKSHMVPINRSISWTQGQIIFEQRQIIWTLCDQCEVFAMSLFGRIPEIKYQREIKGWYSFLSAFTTYMALFVPFIIFARFCIRELLESGLIPVQIIPLAERNHDKISKFNR